MAAVLDKPEEYGSPTGAVSAGGSAGDPTHRGPAPRGLPPVRVWQVSALMAALLAGAILLYVVVLSGLVHQVRQTRQFNAFRSALAAGTAPLGADDSNGHPLAEGAPVALMVIPALHVSQVVGWGTSPEVLTKGPGLYRGGAFPGTVGTVDVFARQASYGGPFRHIAELQLGQKITFTTAGGLSTYKVTEIQRAGDPVPTAPAADSGSLTLLTDSGMEYLPDGVLRVDASLVGQAEPATAPSVVPIAASEGINGTDSTTLWALVFWLQALLVVAIGAVWGWYRWGRLQTWIVGLPLVLLITYYLSDQVTRLLPNLL